MSIYCNFGNSDGKINKIKSFSNPNSSIKSHTLCPHQLLGFPALREEAIQRTKPERACHVKHGQNPHQQKGPAKQANLQISINLMQKMVAHLLGGWPNTAAELNAVGIRHFTRKEFCGLLADSWRRLEGGFLAFLVARPDGLSTQGAIKIDLALGLVWLLMPCRDGASPLKIRLFRFVSPEWTTEQLRERERLNQKRLLALWPLARANNGQVEAIGWIMEMPPGQCHPILRQHID